MADRFRILLSGSAAADLRAVPRNRRGRLTMRLTSLAASEPRSGLIAIWAWTHLAACEALRDRRVVLVYAVLEHRGLLHDLQGVALTGKLRDRAFARFMHGRR